MQRLLISASHNYHRRHHHPHLIIIARYAIMGYMYFKSKHFDDERGWCGMSVDTDVVDWQDRLHQILVMPTLRLIL